MLQAYLDLISKRKKGLFASLMRGVLWLLSFAYFFAIYLRSKLLRQRYRPHAKTISIGNIVAGGTGKTPLVIALAQKLCKTASVAILLRGYKGQIEKGRKSLIVTKETLDATLIGDEACLIAYSVPEAMVIVGRDKCQSAFLADQRGAEVILIDDGMQHIALARDLEIVLLDSQNPFGYGYLLPRGLLREPLSSLQRAKIIIITSRNGANDATSIVEVVRKYSSAPTLAMSYMPAGIFDLEDREVQIRPGTKLGAFCAIAKPEQFIATLKGMGFEVVCDKAFADHAKFELEMLEQAALSAKAKGASYLICTQKDRVKLTKFPLSLPIVWLKVEVNIPAELSAVL